MVDSTSVIIFCSFTSYNKCNTVYCNDSICNLSHVLLQVFLNKQNKYGGTWQLTHVLHTNVDTGITKL